MLLSVSLAAQIGTLPFLLHYFHQFPTWFLLANLMVIPLVSLILYLSFIVFAVAPILPFVGKLLTQILGWAGQGMLFAVHFVERLPYSLLEGIYPSDLTLLIVITFSISATIFIVYKNFNALVAALILLIAFLISDNLSLYQRLTQKEAVVFNLPGKTLVALTAGKETIWLTTDSTNTIEKLKYYIKPYEGFRGIEKTSIIRLSQPSNLIINKFSHHGNFLNFQGLTLCLFKDWKQEDIDWKHFPQTDIVILSEKCRLGPAVVRKYLPAAVIIENRTMINKDTQSLVESKDFKIMDTSTGGAVKIIFRYTGEREKNFLKCEYFNR
jgi:competence protein ComEC